jgi:hypothetical protein
VPANFDLGLSALTVSFSGDRSQIETTHQSADRNKLTLFELDTLSPSPLLPRAATKNF